MLINSEGKIFGKVSIIDILIVILVITAVIAAYFRLNKTVDNAAVETTEFYYTISVEEIRENSKNKLIKDLGKEFLLKDNESVVMGTLESYEVFDAKSSITLNDGSVKEVLVPEKYDVNLTFKITGYEKDDGFYTMKLTDLCAGKTYNITSLHCCVLGTIDKIWK